MNTIYDNTFVLGSTSATNFIAGNGITIDSPSEGTVRIATDETVLWSGDASPSLSITTGAWSESLSNFERVRMYWKNNDQGSYKCAEYPTEDGLDYFGDCCPYRNWWKGISVMVNNTGFSDIKCWEMTLGSPTTGVEKDSYHFLKLVGINRINGGNE